MVDFSSVDVSSIDIHYEASRGAGNTSSLVNMAISETGHAATGVFLSTGTNSSLNSTGPPGDPVPLYIM
ncbi:hypothetical protein BgiBS90_005701, partial [Biomphalaria glabrata]